MGNSTKSAALAGQFLINSVWLVCLSLLGILLMDAGFYQNWFGFIAISCIPSLIIINAVWAFSHPGLLARIESQPWRGLAFTLLAGVQGLLIAWLGMRWIGHGIAPPTPFLMMFVILSVVAVMWQLLVFEGWPFNGLGGHLQGWAMLGASYLLAYGVYRVCFDFSALPGLADAWYAVAPAGLFEPWSAIVFSITTLGVLFAFQLLEFKPFSQLKTRRHFLARQPCYGMLVGGVALLLSLFVFWLATGYFELDPVVFMVAGPVSFLFGLFLIQDTTGGRVLIGMPQPGRGAVLIVMSMALGAAMCALYRWFMHQVLDPVVSGAPAYTAELWLANAMLSVTFPLILIHCHFFGCWPIKGWLGLREERIAPASHT